MIKVLECNIINYVCYFCEQHIFNFETLIIFVMVKDSCRQKMQIDMYTTLSQFIMKQPLYYIHA